MYRNDYKSLGELIKCERESKLMNQKTLALQMGVTVTSVSTWELDKQKPSLASLNKLSIVLGVPVKAMIKFII